MGYRIFLATSLGLGAGVFVVIAVVYVALGSQPLWGAGVFVLVALLLLLLLVQILRSHISSDGEFLQYRSLIGVKTVNIVDIDHVQTAMVSNANYYHGNTPSYEVVDKSGVVRFRVSPLAYGNRRLQDFFNSFKIPIVDKLEWGSHYN